MVSNYALFNIVAHVFCAAIVSILLYKQMTSTNQVESQFVFSQVLISQLAYFVCHCLKVLVSEAVLPRTSPSLCVAEILSLISFSIPSYVCFIYIVVYHEMPLFRRKSARGIAAIPLVINGLLTMTSPWSHLYFYLTDAGTLVKTSSWIASPIVSCAYPIVGVIASFAYRGSLDRAERGHYRFILAFPLMIIASSLLQLSDMSMPLICYGLTLADLFVYITYTDSLISKDPLTGINNRNELSRYLTFRLRQPEVSKSLYLLMVDANRFKQINDTYGHAEGDHALVLLSTALKKVSSSREYRCFISRWGGDEFVVVAELPGKTEAAELAEHIKAAVAEEAQLAGVPYQLQVSVGYACSRRGTNTENMSGLMAEADKMLYAQKNQISAQKA